MELSAERSMEYGRMLCAQDGVMRHGGGGGPGEYSDGVRLAKMLALQRSIQNGDYMVDAYVMADRLISAMRN